MKSYEIHEKNSILSVQTKMFVRCKEMIITVSPVRTEKKFLCSTVDYVSCEKHIS